MAERDARAPQVSVIIPARNEAATIARVIEALVAEPCPPGLEVIVADGRSMDGTRDVVDALAKTDQRIRLVDNPAGVTPEGLNAAIRASRGQVIVRMDGHAEPSLGYVATCLTVLQASGAWNVGGRMQKVGLTAAGRAASAATSSGFGIGSGRRFHLLQEPADVDSVWLGCWPRWVFERVGLFDPEMIQDQDEELNQRILDAGGRIRFDPAIAATYLSRATWQGLFRQYFRYGLFKVRGIQKRPSLLRLRHLAPPALVAGLLAGLLLMSVSPWFAVATTAAVGSWLAIAALAAFRVAHIYGSSIGQVIFAFACIQVAYGAGFWAGTILFAPRWVLDRRGRVPALEPSTR